jgi:hypothetical protein
MARENAGWGYDRIAGPLKNPGHTVSDQSIGNILKRHDIPKAPQSKTKTTWAELIPSHTGSRTSQGLEITGTKSQPQRLRIALGALGQRVVLIQADLVR